MEQIRIFSDKRLGGHCIYCFNEPETREHVPSKALLDKPYPPNLPIVEACEKCNQGFSLDEEYLACLLECVLCGTTDPDLVQKEKIGKILKRKPKLRERLEKSKKVINGQTHFQSEVERIERVIKKLAQGHAKFENSETQFEEPYRVWFQPITLMTETESDDFFANEELTLIPEIGSRAFQRTMVDEMGIPKAYWKEVQENNYSYSIAHVPSGLRIRILIRNYLVGEVIWE